MSPLPSRGFIWNIKSYFLWKTKKKHLWMSSAAVVNCALRFKSRPNSGRANSSLEANYRKSWELFPFVKMAKKQEGLTKTFSVSTYASPQASNRMYLEGTWSWGNIRLAYWTAIILACGSSCKITVVISVRGIPQERDLDFWDCFINPPPPPPFIVELQDWF